MATKRLIISLDEDRYEDLRRLAFEKKASMADLLRHALEKTFEDEMDAIAGERSMQEYLADPSGAVTLDELLEEFNIELPGRAAAKGKTRLRKAAS
jgi:hypothetical protein